MRITHSLLALAVAASLAPLAVAQPTVCKAQLVNTACGSGRVEIELDPVAQTFTLLLGDVACWGADHNLEGISEPVARHYPFYSDHEYRLSTLSRRSGVPQELGVLIIDPELHVASLRLTQTHLSIVPNYNLACD
jgi:hypothetical protein